jgi:hypothetical protein
MSIENRVMKTGGISSIYFRPPVAIARVGGSSMPMEAFYWAEDPRCFGAGNTVAMLAVSLEVMEDGSLDAYLPRDLRFRDGGLIRPVCPFLELHAQIKSGDEQKDVPLTPALLKSNGLDLTLLSFEIRAANRKAARRTGQESCSFEARCRILGNDHKRHKLPAYTHAATTAPPLVLAERPILLGHVQIIRPARTGIARLGIALDTIRIRFTPGTGQVYGPPAAVEGETDDSRAKHMIVPPQNRILNPQAAWATYDFDDPPVTECQPVDTYDGASDIDRGNLSWGVVDDTCDVIITAELTARDRTLTATARIFVGPPDYAPDRRPFYSLADELADRDPTSVPDPRAADAVELGEAVHDLFRRVLETASLTNVDRQRLAGVVTNEMLLPADALKHPPPGFPSMSDDTMTPADKMKGKVLLSDFAKGLLEQSAGDDERDVAPLVRAEIARQQHQRLAEPDYLISFLLDNAERFREIARPPYAWIPELGPEPGADDPLELRDPRRPRDMGHDMRMPPYMRDSDFGALSLTRRQWDMVWRYIELLQSKKKGKGEFPESSPTHQHMRRVLSRRGEKASRTS